MERLIERIRREGPVSYSIVVEAALYDPDDGYYASEGRAGRRGDFITSPEVGPLFGAVLARGLDSWWTALGRPDRYVVIEYGSGTGALGRSIEAAKPSCSNALSYVDLERDDAPPDEPPHIVLANELLDNLPFDLGERQDGQWHDVRVGLDDAGELVETLGSAMEIDLRIEAADGARIPLQRAAADWLATVLALEPQRIVVFDYVDTTASMAGRPWTDWVRTYRAHQRGRHPLRDLGRQDITVDVAVDQLAAVRPPDRVTIQAEFLREHGIDQLVDDARQTWSERAHIGDLQAVKARSRIGEAAALTDPAGLGGFKVIEWHAAPGPPLRHSAEDRPARSY